MLLCGRFPPVFCTAAGFIATLVAAAAYRGGADAGHTVVMRRHLARQQCHSKFAAGLAQNSRSEPTAVPLIHGRRRLQIGQGKIACSIPPKGCAEQRKQGGVLGD